MRNINIISSEINVINQIAYIHDNNTEYIKSWENVVLYSAQDMIYDIKNFRLVKYDPSDDEILSQYLKINEFSHFYIKQPPMEEVITIFESVIKVANDIVSLICNEFVKDNFLRCIKLINILNDKSCEYHDECNNYENCISRYSVAILRILNVIMIIMIWSKKY